MTRMQSLRDWNTRRRLRRDAYAVLKEARRVARRYAHRLSTAQAKTLASRADELGRTLRSRGDVAAPMQSLLQLLDGELSFTRKSTARQYVESIGGVVFVALLLRSFVVEAYQIPSGSMIPTLQVGDHIWVNKLIYGLRIPFTDIKFGTQYRPPRRGEIVVFTHPREPEKDLIKRVVAVGGDEVEMRDEVVYVNGVPTEREHAGPLHYFDFLEEPQQWVERDADAWHERIGKAQFTTLHDSVLGMRAFAKYKVPERTLFVMGDNRDFSSDSRYWGVVPLNLVRGKAMVVWWSYGQPEGVRVDRFGHLIE
jgi:signal peptidase I